MTTPCHFLKDVGAQQTDVDDAAPDLRVNFGARGLVQQSAGKEVAKRLPHVVVKRFPNCDWHRVQERQWWKRKGHLSTSALGVEKPNKEKLFSCFVEENRSHNVTVVAFVCIEFVTCFFYQVA